MHLSRPGRTLRTLGICALLVVPPALAQKKSAVPTSTPAVQLSAAPHSFDRGSVGLWQTLQKLQTRASLLMITAHPDDEDGPALTYESRHDGVRADLLSLTRGEAGQNSMSADTWDDLGILRTEELLAADRYYGVGTYWSRVADFGFTKTKEEAFAKWNHDRVLYDAVRVVRMTRPLVVMSVFAGNVSDGHGQHQVSGEIVQEAYQKAGDPNVFPDQIRDGLLPWTPLKVYIRVPFANITSQGVYDYATGHWAPAIFHNYVDGTDLAGKPAADVSLPVGQYDPLLGLSYFQLARLGLGLQKSQNDGLGLPLAESVSSDYHLYASRLHPPAPATAQDASFFGGIDVSISGIATLAPAPQQAALRAKLSKIQTAVVKTITAYSAVHPENCADALAEGLGATNALVAQVSNAKWRGDDAHSTARQNVLSELHSKQQQFGLALAQALGISMRSFVIRDAAPSNVPAIFRGFTDTFRVAVPGQRFQVEVHLANGSSAHLQIASVQLVAQSGENWSITQPRKSTSNLNKGASTESVFSVRVPEDAKFTQPYFDRPNIEQPYYDLLNFADQNLSTAPYPLHAVATLRYRNVEFSVEQRVATVRKEQGLGPVFEPLLVGPAISVKVTPQIAILPLSNKTLHVTASIQSNLVHPATGNLSLQVPQGWTVSPDSAQFATEKNGDAVSVDFTVTPHDIATRSYMLKAIAKCNGKVYASGFHMTGYPALRPYPVYRDASMQVHAADVHVAHGLHIAYVVGTGDEVPEALRQLGINPQILSAQDLSQENLSRFDAIVLGIRAYAIRKDLKTYNDRLLHYVKDGGVLVVQYNTAGFKSDDAPFPLDLSSSPEKVIDENSVVTILHPDDPLLAWPNVITTKNFGSWIEERGHGFLRSWDSRYTSLLEMHDPEQAPQQGGLIYAHYGKGIYVYTALSLDRQMPEGVPGAYRIFANLISLAKNPRASK